MYIDNNVCHQLAAYTLRAFSAQIGHIMLKNRLNVVRNVYSARFSAFDG